MSPGSYRVKPNRVRKESTEVVKHLCRWVSLRCCVINVDSFRTVATFAPPRRARTRHQRHGPTFEDRQIDHPCTPVSVYLPFPRAANSFPCRHCRAHGLQLVLNKRPCTAMRYLSSGAVFLGLAISGHYKTTFPIYMITGFESSFCWD